MHNQLILNAINNGHVDVLKAHLEGKVIQAKFRHSKHWDDWCEPRFYSDCQYRVKPEEPKEVNVFMHKNTETGVIFPSRLTMTGDNIILLEIIKYKVK